MHLPDETLREIIKSIRAFFVKHKLGEVKVSTAYLSEKGMLPSSDYCGVIHLKGGYEGVVYVTCPEDTLRRILAASGSEFTEVLGRDTIGEMANIFTGNMQEVMGDDFDINPPVTIVTRDVKLQLPIDDDERAYVIPFIYVHKTSMFVIYFRKSKTF